MAEIVIGCIGALGLLIGGAVGYKEKKELEKKEANLRVELGKCEEERKNMKDQIYSSYKTIENLKNDIKNCQNESEETKKGYERNLKEKEKLVESLMIKMAQKDLEYSTNLRKLKDLYQSVQKQLEDQYVAHQKELESMKQASIFERQIYNKEMEENYRRQNMQNQHIENLTTTLEKMNGMVKDKNEVIKEKTASILNLLTVIEDLKMRINILEIKGRNKVQGIETISCSSNTSKTSCASSFQTNPKDETFFRNLELEVKNGELSEIEKKKIICQYLTLKKMRRGIRAVHVLYRALKKTSKAASPCTLSCYLLAFMNYPSSEHLKKLIISKCQTHNTSIAFNIAISSDASKPVPVETYIHN